jgi:hypothetical protein
MTSQNMRIYVMHIYEVEIATFLVLVRYCHLSIFGAPL